MIQHIPLHPDGFRPERVRRFPEEWCLVEADYDELTGRMKRIYESHRRGADGKYYPITYESYVYQPSNRTHSGWKWFDGRVTP